MQQDDQQAAPTLDMVREHVAELDGWGTENFPFSVADDRTSEPDTKSQLLATYAFLTDKKPGQGSGSSGTTVLGSALEVVTELLPSVGGRRRREVAPSSPNRKKLSDALRRMSTQYASQKKRWYQGWSPFAYGFAWVFLFPITLLVLACYALKDAMFPTGSSKLAKHVDEICAVLEASGFDASPTAKMEKLRDPLSRLAEAADDHLKNFQPNTRSGEPDSRNFDALYNVSGMVATLQAVSTRWGDLEREYGELSAAPEADDVEQPLVTAPSLAEQASDMVAQVSSVVDTVVGGATGGSSGGGEDGVTPAHGTALVTDGNSMPGSSMMHDSSGGDSHLGSGLHEFPWLRGRGDENGGGFDDLLAKAAALTGPLSFTPKPPGSHNGNGQEVQDDEEDDRTARLSEGSTQSGGSSPTIRAEQQQQQEGRQDDTSSGGWRQTWAAGWTATREVTATAAAATRRGTQSMMTATVAATTAAQERWKQRSRNGSGGGDSGVPSALDRTLEHGEGLGKLGHDLQQDVSQHERQDLSKIPGGDPINSGPTRSRLSTLASVAASSLLSSPLGKMGGGRVDSTSPGPEEGKTGTSDVRSTSQNMLVRRPGEESWGSCSAYLTFLDSQRIEKGGTLETDIEGDTFYDLSDTGDDANEFDKVVHNLRVLLGLLQTEVERAETVQVTQFTLGLGILKEKPADSTEESQAYNMTKATNFMTTLEMLGIRIELGGEPKHVSANLAVIRQEGRFLSKPTLKERGLFSSNARMLCGLVDRDKIHRVLESRQDLSGQDYRMGGVRK